MNFALILFLATLFTGAVALADRLVFAKHRAADAPEPWWIEYPKSFFPVLLIVFVLRSFVAEPFKIPSSSMRPTLEVGDFILVNKFAYGIRLPIVEQKIVPLGDPKRGDVVVFRYPLNPSQDFIKRVVGVGGDTVAYKDKQLTVNGTPLPLQAGRHVRLRRGPALRVARTRRRDRRHGERAEGARASRPTRRCRPSVRAPCGRFPARRTAITIRTAAASSCKVPAGHYFMMGDNRDHSDDSRYWGFVPDDHIRGRAFFIWFNWDDISSLRVQARRQRDSIGAAMSERKRQRGLTIIGFVLVVAVIAIFVVVGARMVPAYIEWYSVQKALEKTLADAKDPTAQVDLRRTFAKYIATDYIDSVTANDLEVTKQGNEVVATVAWTRKLPPGRQREPVARFRGDGKAVSGVRRPVGG